MSVTQEEAKLYQESRGTSSEKAVDKYFYEKAELIVVSKNLLKFRNALFQLEENNKLSAGKNNYSYDEMQRKLKGLIVEYHMRQAMLELATKNLPKIKEDFHIEYKKKTHSVRTPSGNWIEVADLDRDGKQIFEKVLVSNKPKMYSTFDEETQTTIWHVSQDTIKL